MKVLTFRRRVTAALLLFGVIAISCVGMIVRASAESESQTRVYCTATVDQSFSDNEIIVVINAAYNDRLYTAESFSEIGCVEITELTHNVNLGDRSRIIKLTIAENSKEGVLEAIEQLEQREDVYSAEPNYYLAYESTPNDPHYAAGNQWAVNKISLPAAWDIETGSASIYVGIVDSGIDASHPDLVNRVDISLSRSFTDETESGLTDLDGHGTMVAGIVGAQGNNGAGVVGVCWNVRLVSLEVGSTEPQLAALVAAINYAESIDLPIINISAGIANAASSTPFPSLETAIQNYNGLVVCSAGNDSMDNDIYASYPACSPQANIISVGASDQDDLCWYASNYGENSVDIYAPGAAIYSCYPTALIASGYRLDSGTSFAAPYVTGVAALLLSMHPELSTAELKQIVLDSVDVVYDDSGDVFGELCVSGGRLNAYKAVVSGLIEHTYRYTNAGLHTGHTCACTVCEYSHIENHTWVELTSAYKCSKCLLTSAYIPVTPSNIPSDILTQAQMLAVTEENFISIGNNVALCCVDGQYYLVKGLNYSEALQMIRDEGD